MTTACRPALVLFAALLAAAEPAPVAIRIDAGAAGAPVNPRLFGQFIKGADNFGIFSIPHPDVAAIAEGDGIWDPEAGAPVPGALAILRAYRPGLLRYPDGLGVHNHDWKRTIGPVAERGDRRFGLGEFLTLARAVDGEPILVVSEYIGTAQDAADLVEYLNAPADDRHPWAQRRAADGHAQPAGVVRFEIGNESWVDWRKTGTPQVRPAAEVGRHASALARAMKAVDPRIRCGVPVLPEDRRWSAAVLGGIDDAIDFAVIHTYPVKYGGGDLEGAKEALLLDAMLAAGYTTRLDLARWRADIRAACGRDLPLVLSEYNLGPTQQGAGLRRPYRFTLAAALGTGDYLGRLLDPAAGVEAAVYWNWLNGFFEAVHTYAGHPWTTRAKLAQPRLRPVHFIHALWARQRGDVLLPVAVEAPSLDFPGMTSVDPCLGGEARPAAPLGDADLVTDARHLTSANPGIAISAADERTWRVRYAGVAGDAYPNLLLRPLADLPAGQRPPAAGLVYRLSFEARWTPAPGAPAANLGFGLMDARGWAASGSAISVYGLQDARDWTAYEAVYRPLPDTAAIVALARLQGASAPVAGDLEIRALRIAPWRAASYPARPALSAYATRSADGARLFVTVFNLTRDRDLDGRIAWDGFAAGAARLSELNGDSAAATGEDGAAVGWRIADAPLPLAGPDHLAHRFPAHSATAIVLERAVSP